MSGSDIEGQPISDELIDRIADTIGVSDPQKRGCLTYHLRDIAANAEGYKLYKVIRNPSKLKRAFAQTVKNCDRLLKTLSTEPEGVTVQVANVTLQPFHRLLLWELAADRDGVDPNRALNDGTAENIFDEHVGSVTAIRDAAGRARDGISDRVATGRGGRRHLRDWAFDVVLRQLVQLYEEVTGLTPRTAYSFKTKQAAGPLIRYLALCLPPLGWCLGPDAIRSHLRRLNGDRRS